MGKSVALVLASGGARGMAHIGVIEELSRHGFEISSIAGSSFGAVVGGIYAAGRLTEFKEWLLNLDKMDVFRLMDFTLSSHGFIKGNKVFGEIAPLIDQVQIEDLHIPFAAVATDPHEQNEVIFRTGSLIEAIRASVAIPSIIEPYEIDGKELVDGGVLNPMPLDLVARKPGDLLVAVDINSPIPYRHIKKKSLISIDIEKNSLIKRLEFNENWERFFPKEKEESGKFGYLALLNKSYDMMQNKITRLMVEKFKPDILVSISRNICSTFDFFKAAEIIEMGKTAFNKALKEYDEQMIKKFREQTKL
jgi:NTE family protein